MDDQLTYFPFDLFLDFSELKFRYNVNTGSLILEVTRPLITIPMFAELVEY